jgi:hypothetical protein
MRRNSSRIILLFTVIVVSGFAAHSIAQTSTVVTFDNPAPPGPPDSYLNGIFGGINWGTNQ